MDTYKTILETKNYVISEVLIKEIVKHKLSLNEFLLLLYLINSDQKVFDLEKINKALNIDNKELLQSFNNLVHLQLINVQVKTLPNGKVSEHISLDGLYNNSSMKIKEDVNLKQQETIYDIFEREFNRKLTPMEYEIINAWLDNNTSEEIIVGALKEAIYNGVQNFRYIDKIIYEWNKKNFKTMDDVKKYMQNNKKEEPKELFDYDWLDDNEV